MRLVPSIYDSEALLQRLVAEFPSLFDGGGEDAPAGRLLLITREMPVPDAEGGPDRWSLDHLFVDRDGVPTLVEVKRSRDPPARREQMGNGAPTGMLSGEIGSSSSRPQPLELPLRSRVALWRATAAPCNQLILQK